MNVLNETHNMLLKRREVLVSLSHAGAPSMPAVVKLVAEHFKAGEDTVAVKRIDNKRGTHQFIIDAFVYDSHEQRTKIEPKPKQKKVVA